MWVEQVWRYPVKSVGGEQLTAATLTGSGLDGDRRLAVRDGDGEVTWAGAIPELMQLQAAAAGGGAAEVTLPGGERLRTDAPDADARLSAAVGRTVTVSPHPPPVPEQALHVITTGALESLEGALPESAIDVTRFRPNLVLAEVGDESGSGYPESGWVGRRLAIGEVRLRFTKPCERCVMITKETPTVPHDRAVLRWVARELGNDFGAYAAVERPGLVRVGDEARWLD